MRLWRIVVEVVVEIVRYWQQHFRVPRYSKLVGVGSIVLIVVVQPLAAQNQTTGDYPFRIGINFPFRGPETATIAQYLQWLNEIPANGMRQMTYADVLWGSVEPQDNQWDFVKSDSALFNPFGIYPIPTLYFMGTGVNSTGLQCPWRACSDPGCGWFEAQDSADSRDYVQTVVQRYQSVTHHWEIANEMDGHTRRPTGMPEADFARFLVLNRQWIQAVDPQAKILLPGLLGTYGLPYATPMRWLRNLLAAGGGEGFDIMNYHDYNAWWTLPAHFDSVKTILTKYGYGDKPIWVTECGVSSDPTNSITPTYVSETQQAADVWRRSSVLFAKGVQTWFWHSFYSSGGQSEWREFGLLNANGEKKKAYFAYQLLLQKIEGFDAADSIVFGEVTDDNTTGGDGQWVVRYRWNDGTVRWVMWSPTQQPYTLTVPANMQVNIIRVVPVSLSADRETAQFDVQTIVPADTTVSIPLTDIPVLVEVEPVTAIETPDPIPQTVRLLPNYPNPFNPGTTIPFELAQPARVELTIVNNVGEVVRHLIQETLPSGTHRIWWDGQNDAGRPVPSGMYFSQLRVGGTLLVRAMLLMK